MLKAGWKRDKFANLLQKVGTIDPAKQPKMIFKYVDVSSVSRETLEIDNVQEILGKDAPSRARRHIKKGDVLFATIRPTLKRIAIIPDYLDDQVCSTGYFVFRATSEIYNGYIFYYLLSKSFSDAMESLQKGASYPAVNDNDVKDQFIIYPPLPEQKRIVAILDEAFANISQAVANAEKNLANARELFDSYLNEVFTRKGEGWTSATISEVIKFIDYRGKTPVKTESGIRLITAKNIKMGYLQKHPMEFIASDSYDDWMTRGIPRKGDILFTTEAPLANVAQLDTDNKVAFAQRVIIMQPNKSRINSDFLKYLLISDSIQQLIHAKGTGATVKGIKASLLKLIEIPFPSDIQSQITIANKLDELTAQIQQLEDIYRRKLAALAELKQALLQKAFTGEL